MNCQFPKSGSDVWVDDRELPQAENISIAAIDAIESAHRQRAAANSSVIDSFVSRIGRLMFFLVLE